MPITFTHPTTQDKTTVNIQPGSIVISPRYGESASFDRAGRLLSLFLAGRSIQRTLDHRLLLRQKNTLPRRIELSTQERDTVLDQVFTTLHTLAENLPQANLTPLDHTAVSTALHTILTMHPARLAVDGQTYRDLLLPVSILPPDQYLALVVQATEGCSWNRCTFCGLYRDRRFRIRGIDEFRAHCTAIRDFFGAGLSLRRGLFLADANALTIPQPRLEALIMVAQEIFGQHDAPRPLYSFVSAFDTQRKFPADWANLRAKGLTRVYIGLESGDDELLHFVKKPGTSADAITAVSDLKSAGIAVGVIVMIGLGGNRYAAQHTAHTIETLQAMPLDHHDVIYLSAYRPAPLTEYPAQIAAIGIQPLTQDQEKAQQRTLTDALRVYFPQTRIAPYHVDGFAL